MIRKKRPAAKPKRGIRFPNDARARAAALTAEIPERGLKIGEAAARIGVETFVLRFWETQFPFLKPRHTRSRHRFYHERDLEVLSLIKRLLHREGFTIAGANKHIRTHGIDALLAEKPTAAAKRARSQSEPANGRTDTALSDAPARRVLGEVRRDLEILHRMLRE